MAELRRSKRKKTAEEPEKMMSEPEKMRKKMADSEKMMAEPEKMMAEPEKMMAEPEKIPFERGVCNLLDKMNGISQGTKEVVLWELVRNSGRALYDFRCRTLYDQTDLIGDERLFIDIIPDKDKKTLSIVDNGIGMTLDDLKSIFINIPEHTLEKYNITVDKVRKRKIKVDEFYSRNLNARLGFLSAYMVADKVEITTKHYAGNSQCRMFSSASERWCSFVEEDLVAPVSVGRGTRVTLQLNKDYFEYLEECRLKVLIEKSTFDVCPYPVSIHARDITLGRSADLEESKEDMKLLKRKFEPLRRLFRKELKNEVEKVVVSDRIFDLPSFLSLDKTTLEINPRNSLMENLRQDAEFDPNDKEVLDLIYSQYVVGETIIDLHTRDAFLQYL